MITKLPKRVPHRAIMLEEFKKGGLVVEVGVLLAGYSHFMWKHLQPDRMILIDIWEDYPAPQGEDWSGEYQYAQAQKFAEGKNVELWKGWSTDLIPKLPDKGVRVAYIDASHDYDNVLADLEAMLPKMESGGWLAGHDYCPLAMYGVVRATAVFCDRHNLTVDVLTRKDPCSLKRMPPKIKEVNLFSFAIQIP